jgi:hypothetical protein
VRGHPIPQAFLEVRPNEIHDRRPEGLILSIYESLIVTAPASSNMREKWGPSAYTILTLSIRRYFNAFS